jgi:hypothetical protein
MFEDYVLFPGSATIEEVLRDYRDRGGQWWWLLIGETEGSYTVCSFGSLLPYLTGRTSHIVHNIGDCAICCGIDPLLWTNTGTLIEEALADASIRSRVVSDLPMAELLLVESGNTAGTTIGFRLIDQGLRVAGLTEDGVLCGVYLVQYRGIPGGPPDF